MSLLSLPFFSLSTILFGFLTFLVVLVISLFIVKPLIYLHYYKKQGIPTHFAPGLGFLSLLKRAESEHDDNLYFVKQNAKANPNLECEAYNLGPYTILLIYSGRLLKPFLTNIEPYIKFKNLQPTTLYQKWGFGSLNGNIFRRHRSAVASVFSFDVLGERVPTMVKNAQIACERIMKGGLKDVPLINYTLDFAGDNVGDLFFSGSINNYTVDGKPIMTYAAHLQAESGMLTRSLPLSLFGPGILKLNLLPEHRRFKEKIVKLRTAVATLIQQRKDRGSTGEKDLLSVLLETQKSTDPDIAYTDEMIFDEYVTLFAAGAENPAHTMVMALYLLAGHPEYKKRVLEEIAEIYDKEPKTTNSIHKMNVLHGLMQETLRIHSPSFSTQPRISVKDFKLEDVQVKKGTLMMPVFFHQNYSEAVFDDSFKFKPERWTDGSTNLDSAFKFLPFSAGPRNCLGQHFAILEIKVLLCEFLKRFDFEVSPQYKLVKTQRFLHVPKEAVLFNLTPKKVVE